MQESFERLKAWVQEHPWLSGIILLVVLLIGYLLLKRSGVGSASSSSDLSASATPTDQSGIPAAPADLSASIPTPSVSYDGGGNGGGGGAPVSIPSIPDLSALSGMSSGGETTFTSDMTGLGQNGLPVAMPPTPTNAQALIEVSPQIAAQGRTLGSIASGVLGGQQIVRPASATPTAATPAPAPTRTLGSIASGVSSGQKIVRPVSAPASTYQFVNGLLKYGGNLYTGLYGGRYYQSGQLLQASAQRTAVGTTVVRR